MKPAHCGSAARQVSVVMFLSLFSLDNILLSILQTYNDYCCLIHRLDRFGSASVTAGKGFRI